MFHDWSFLILRCAEILLHVIAYGFYSSIICIFGSGGDLYFLFALYVSCLLITLCSNHKLYVGQYKLNWKSRVFFWEWGKGGRKIKYRFFFWVWCSSGGGGGEGVIILMGYI